MAFTTVTGSNGVTSLVGTTGIDVATIVTLENNVFVGGNTADDSLVINLATAGRVATGYNVRMGGGDDRADVDSTLLNSYVSLDGETIANDGNDVFDATAAIINSEIVGRGGNDVLGVLNNELQLNNSTVNGNTGDDTIRLGASASSFVYGGQNTDTITTANGAGSNSSSVLINGNKGSDTITLGRSAFATGSVYGGNGNDTINADAVTDATGVAGSLNATAAGVMISGDIGDDTITGSDGIDTINGGDGADVIDGGTGADVIDGGTGNDTITGGAGADTIAGGTGNNVFVYTTLTNAALTSATSSTGFDTITGFSANTANTAVAGTAANGDRFQVTALVKTAVGTAAASNVAGSAIFTASQAAGANLAETLDAALDGNLANNGVGLVTITGASSFSGLYVVINGAADANYNFGADAVIKINTLANISGTTFFNA